MEDWVCCVRETELGMFLIKYLFSLEVPHFSKGRKRDKEEREGQTFLRTPEMTTAEQQNINRL